MLFNKKANPRGKTWTSGFVSDSQDSEVFEAGEVVLADDRQVVSVQVAEKRKQQRTGDVREGQVTLKHYEKMDRRRPNNLGTVSAAVTAAPWFITTP